MLQIYMKRKSTKSLMRSFIWYLGVGFLYGYLIHTLTNITINNEKEDVCDAPEKIKKHIIEVD